MKAIVSERTPHTRFTAELPVTVLPDSAILRSGRPWFIPPFAPEWTLETLLVLRISRIGHCIGERFAKRYFDAVTIGVMPRPQPHDRVNGLLDAFDGALIIGEWTPLPADGRIIVTTPAGDIELSDQLEIVPAQIASFSSYATLKMGDMIGICTFHPMHNPQINIHWQGSINGKKVLEFNIK